MLRAQKTQAEQQFQLVRAGPRPERIAAQRATVAQADPDGAFTFKDTYSGSYRVNAFNTSHSSPADAAEVEGR